MHYRIALHIKTLIEHELDAAKEWQKQVKNNDEDDKEASEYIAENEQALYEFLPIYRGAYCQHKANGGK